MSNTIKFAKFHVKRLNGSDKVDFFASVYVPKSNDELPVLQDKDIFQEMELPHIDCNMAEKHLKDLKVSKTYLNSCYTIG